jgi:CheY-like chemotaxis protein
MSTDHPLRVLLVEDQPEVYATLKRRLGAEGYSVTLATTYADARQALDAEHIHLAVVDIRLDVADEKNQDGLRLLEDVAALNLRGAMPCIVLTAFGSLPLALRTLQDLGAARFIPKQPGYIARLLSTIRELQGTQMRIGFDIQYTGNSLPRVEQCARDMHEAEPELPRPDLLVPQIRDALGKLFFGAEQLWIRQTLKGFSGSAVLYVKPTWPNGLGQPLIVKIGPREKIAVEKQSHTEYVEHFLPAHHATRLDDRYTRHLGALLYTLANTEAEDTQEFQAYYQRKSATDVVAALRHLLRDVCRPWYQGHTPPQIENVRDVYLEAFDLKRQPNRLHTEIAALRPDVNAAAQSLTFDPPGLTLPNPLRWLEDDEASLLPVCRCITHGDLNADNVLINDAGQCWLIDFYRTRESHILRDFVVLETDVKFRLAASLSLEEFCQMELALVALDQPHPDYRFNPGASDEAQKAATVIAGLRAEAWDVLERAGDPELRHIQREYLVSLLMATLNVLRLRRFKDSEALRPQRERALLSAALICRQLQVLGG